MKLFFVRIFYFLIPLIFVIGCYEYFLRQINYPNIYSFKDKLLSEEFEAIVLGNSHALRGIIAKDMSYNTISLANVSQTIDIDLTWLKKTIKSHDPKFIILNVSIPTLTGKLADSKEKWRLKNYNLYTRLYLSYKPEYNLEFLTGKTKANIAKIMNYLRDKTENEVDYLKKGSYPLDIHMTDFKNHALETSKRHTRTTEHIENNKDILYEIVDLAKINKFDLILVTPPAHKSYRDLIPKNFKSRCKDDYLYL